MPEILEVELYRRQAAAVVGRRIARVDTPDAWYMKGVDAPTVRRALVGRVVTAARRRGKLLMIDTDGPVLGVRFGMTGRLAVDGEAPLIDLEYGSVTDDPRWDRFGLEFAGGGRLRVHDPRRLGGVILEPDDDALGPDALSISLRQSRVTVGGTTMPIKATLLDQSRVAGLGNMLVDEVLWHAGVDPARSTSGLSDQEVVTLHRAIRRRLAIMLRRGGSHLGDLAAATRVRGARCPRCGAEMDRRTIGGRTTYSCPVDQR